MENFGRTGAFCHSQNPGSAKYKKKKTMHRRRESYERLSMTKIRMTERRNSYRL